MADGTWKNRKNNLFVWQAWVYLLPCLHPFLPKQLEMSIDYFYKIVHLSTTILMISLILNIWIRYIQIEKKTNANRNKNSNSLLLFSLALFLWEYNLFDTDYRYEVFTTIIVNGLLLVAVTYFNNGILLNAGNSKYGAVKSVPAISILLIFISNILINNYPQNLLIGYSLSLAYTLFTFLVISVRLFWYYKAKNLIEIGIVSCLLFTGLYFSIILSIVYAENLIMFGWIKAFYLISTFGLYLIFANLSFNFLQDIINQQYSKIFTGLISPDPETTKKEVNPVDSGFDLNRLIAEDKLEEVIEILLATSKNNSNMMASILLLANRLTNINTAKLRDTIDYGTYRMDRNKIVDSLIQLVSTAQ